MKDKYLKLVVGIVVSMFLVTIMIFILKQEKTYQARGVKEEISFSENLNQIINDEHFIGNVLLIKDDKIFFEASYGFADKQNKIKNQKDTLFPIASLQKMITGAVILQLVEEHKLSLTTSLANYYPEIPFSQKITINDLLNHTSGLIMDEVEPNTVLKTEDSQIQNVISELDVTKSNEFMYTNANYTLLAGIISQISGMSYEKAVTERILKPLEMKQTYFWDHLPADEIIAESYMYTDKNYQKPSFLATEALFSSLLGAGNLYMTTEDMWKFIHGLADGQLFESGVYQQLVNAEIGGYQSGVIYSEDLQYSEGMLGGYNTLIYGRKDGADMVILFGNQAPVNGMISLENKIYQLLEDQN